MMPAGQPLFTPTLPPLADFLRCYCFLITITLRRHYAIDVFASRQPLIDTIIIAPPLIGFSTFSLSLHSIAAADATGLSRHTDISLIYWPLRLPLPAIAFFSLFHAFFEAAAFFFFYIATPSEISFSLHGFSLHFLGDRHIFITIAAFFFSFSHFAIAAGFLAFIALGFSAFIAVGLADAAVFDRISNTF